jgi:hypothetical protein
MISVHSTNTFTQVTTEKKLEILSREKVFTECVPDKHQINSCNLFLLLELNYIQNT